MKTAINGVNVTFWNPRVRSRSGLRLPRRMDNFGDLLGPWIVRKILQDRGVGAPRRNRPDLVTVGTIMYMAPDGATVWGTGTRDTVPRDRYEFQTLDVRAVRGPLTREVLRCIGVEVPEVYGDPGLLTPLVLPTLNKLEKRHDVVYVPNYADYTDWRSMGVKPLINPRSRLDRILEDIASSRAVVASSLHALILADAFSIPSVRVSSGVEGDFKYHDYALGAGRPLHRAATTPVDAIDALEVAPRRIDTSGLLNAFPIDLWRNPPLAADR